ncbi:uncharacterized protein [Nicotiana sylvestris]|uniref:uncharacterized protein n=1 Tax=Nicotiana sylvestris TaxID=4096 RepID=UPI00388CB13F
MCDHCDKKWHIKRFCHKLKQGIRGGRKVENNENNVVAIVRDDLFSYDRNVINLMGNAIEVKVFGAGMVCLKTNNSSMLVLQNVKHAPDFPFHLISIGRLDDESYHNTYLMDNRSSSKAH